MSLRRLLLGALTAAAPVFLAACYGAQVRYDAEGKVVDKASKAAVAGVTVQCASGEKLGQVVVTRDDGSFRMLSRTDCDRLVVSDAKGLYSGVSLLATQKSPITIELERK